ncbi:VanW family protein [Patescibacteria group bacterium]|nr:VanW family protein [Patescibacteria group bacterium]
MITATLAMVKEKKSSKHGRFFRLKFTFSFFTLLAIFMAAAAAAFIYTFEKTYQNKIYAGVRIDNLSVGGKTKKDIEKYFSEKNQPFKNIDITLKYHDNIATLSGQDLAVSYDGKLSAIQAYSIGRSGHVFSDIYQKWQAATRGINLTSLLKMNTDNIDETLSNLAADIDIPSQDALFQFTNNKVTLFKESKVGRMIDQKQAKKMITAYIYTISHNPTQNLDAVTIDLPVVTLQPKISTENSNNFGIKELIGEGKSEFAGSIPNRVHNIALAAFKINGNLVPPGGTFSFNNTVGDISAATGFAPGYIIKDGRTVLGDGGGVCQVSTTLFRAAMNSGLKIVERHAHAYRVHYYEEDAPPGLDATVFAPSYDFRFQNDTTHYILIQSETDTANNTLDFKFYGTKDDRVVNITKPIILSQTPPPPDLYQDDPLLPKGTIRQVDWQAWGAKVTFDYKVTKDGQILEQQTFFSNFQPWQAVYLRGTAG